jgi:hypothetical protein
MAPAFLSFPGPLSEFRLCLSRASHGLSRARCRHHIPPRCRRPQKRSVRHAFQGPFLKIREIKLSNRIQPGPPVASKNDPTPVLAGREWGAECYARFLKRQLSLPVSMMSQWCVSRSSMAVVILAWFSVFTGAALFRLRRHQHPQHRDSFLENSNDSAPVMASH